jgi:hypothetical protein
MDKKLKTRPSISSFTGHFTKRSSAVDSVKGLPPAGKSAGPSAGPSASSSSRPTSNQEIADARKAYRASRARILADYYEQRGLTPVPVENLFEPLLSANGDIQSDFGVLSHVADDQQLKEFERILLDVYGVDTLVSQVDNMWVTPEDDGQYVRITYNCLEFLRMPKRSLSSSHGEDLRTVPVY